jgi:serine protease Do
MMNFDIVHALRCCACACIIALAPIPGCTADEKPSAAHNFSQPFIDAAKKSQPSVVSIKSRMKKGSSQMWQRDEGQEEVLPEDFWERFFGNPFPSERRREPQPRFAYGSGFIVSSDGYILTNNHVVERADTVNVTLLDGRTFVAKKVGTDPSTDIAVLKIDATGLPAVALADSSKVEVGEWVLAVGNPFGLQASVTAGIISAKGRSDLDIVRVEKFFQTDAAINMGNSGGMLVDLDGDVIGMNTAIATNTGGHMGIGFAIPSNLLKEVMQELIETGHLTRGYLGVALQPVDADIATAVGLEKPQGVLVSEVLPDSPAEKAGLRSGDVILELDQSSIEGLGSLRSSIALMKPGQKVTMKVLREGHELVVTATITQNPDEDGRGNTIEDTCGFAVEPVTPELAKRHKLDVKAGLLIMQIDPESQAYQSGLRPGHVIIAINGHSLTTVDEFSKIVQSAKPGSRLLLQVKVGPNIRFVPLTID